MSHDEPSDSASVDALYHRWVETFQPSDASALLIAIERILRSSKSQIPAEDADARLIRLATYTAAALETTGLAPASVASVMEAITQMIAELGPVLPPYGSYGCYLFWDVLIPRGPEAIDHWRQIGLAKEAVAALVKQATSATPAVRMSALHGLSRFVDFDKDAHAAVEALRRDEDAAVSYGARLVLLGQTL